MLSLLGQAAAASRKATSAGVGASMVTSFARSAHMIAHPRAVATTATSSFETTPAILNCSAPYGWNHHCLRSQIRYGIDRIGSSQTRMSGIFLVTLSGSSVARKPSMAPARRLVAVQPYQYMAGPSPLLDASHPQTM